MGEDPPLPGVSGQVQGARPPHAAHEAIYRAYVEALTRDERIVVLRKGESRFCRLIDKALRVLTLGKQDRFLTSYTTTLGRRIYVPDDWDRYPAGERYLVLRHEAVHVRQFRRLTWPGMVLVYLFLPVPMGFAAGRAWLEWEGYRETLVATWQLEGRAAARSPALENHIAERFSGADYAWMWVAEGMVRRAIARTLRSLEKAPPPPLEWPAAGVAEGSVARVRPSSTSG
ncbi:MAG: hypothetical protein JNJ59_23365 [Deltaproteobacteria bacterium]|nr:hypothetical protein [Deltaproteobacteria bacterium]